MNIAGIMIVDKPVGIIPHGPVPADCCNAFDFPVQLGQNTLRICSSLLTFDICECIENKKVGYEGQGNEKYTYHNT